MPIAPEPHRQFPTHDLIDPNTLVLQERERLQAQVKPSDVAPPTEVDTAPQQGSTQPGDGSEVHTEPREMQASTSSDPEQTGSGPTRIPFKEQVIGFAKKTRGTVLRKPSLKEHGNQILEGQVTSQEPPKLD